jgi:PTS hybrid protein
VIRALAGLSADVRLSTDDRDAVDARSVLAVMGLGAVAGQVVRVVASGPDAESAVAAVTAVLVEAEAIAG